MNDAKDLKKLNVWDCDNEHLWLSYPGPHKDTWHMEQLHESTTATNMKLDAKTAWLVAGPDASICPICAMRMRMNQRIKVNSKEQPLLNRKGKSRKISA